jgi:hypothetical protein
MMLLALLFAWGLSGASPEQAIVWSYEEQTCVAIASDQKEATDVIVTISYRSRVILSGSTITDVVLHKILTFPVYYGVSSMSDCAPVPLNQVQKIDVRWLKQVVPQ